MLHNKAYATLCSFKNMKALAPPDETVVIVKIDPSKLPEDTRLDLEANARLKRKTPAELLAEIISKRFGDVFTVTAAPTPAHV